MGFHGASHPPAAYSDGIIDASGQRPAASGQRAGHEKAPTQGRGSSVEETRNQWAQPPALAGAPSVLKDDPQAQLLTAFGLLMAKPEPMSEST